MELLTLILNVAVKPADVTALLAFAIVMPTTFGIVLMTTGWGPLLDTVRFTAIPDTTTTKIGDPWIPLGSQLYPMPPMSRMQDSD